MNNTQTQMYWNTKTYGNAIKLHKSFLKAFIAFICIITPFTNWMIPIVFKLIKKDLYVRF